MENEKIITDATDEAVKDESTEEVNAMGTQENVSENAVAEETAKDEVITESEAAKPLDTVDNSNESVDEKELIKEFEADIPRGQTIKTVGFRGNEVGRSRIVKLPENPLVKQINDFYYYKNHNEILWGRVSSVYEIFRRNAVFATVLLNGVNVRIEDKDYFEPTFIFGNRYEALDEKGKTKFRSSRIKAQIGAIVPFVITNIYKDGDAIVVIGSRRKAMAKLRDIYFLHKETEGNNEIKVGDIINEAHVIVPLQYRVILECCGVEIRPDAHDLGYERSFDCRDAFKPGDTIKNLRITKLHINEDDENNPVYLDVSCRIPVSFETVKRIQKKSTYMGIVQSYNAKKDTYYVILADSKVPVLCKKSKALGDITLTEGDYVAVLINTVTEKYVVGVITRL